MSIIFRAGNCLDVFGDEPDDSFDALVSDWPAAISFMGRGWDKDHGGRDAWVKVWSEVAAMMLRKAKPGAYSLTWALPRTAGWTQTALENGGWFVQDTVVHVFGQGWPKGKAALKPAAEHWILARKPGGSPRLQIDAARVARGDAIRPFGSPQKSSGGMLNGTGEARELFEQHSGGSWPPNFCLSHCPECEERGTRTVSAGNTGGEGGGRGGMWNLASGDGRPVGRQYGAPDGTESIPAFDCLAGCDCGAAHLHPSGGEPPTCACGRAMFWCCPVAEMDAQSGDLPPPGNTKPLVMPNTRLTCGDRPRIVTPEMQFKDHGGASRFFPRFSPDILAKHGTMSGTQEVPSSCEHASSAGETSPRSGERSGSADISAVVCTSPGNAGKSERCGSHALDAGQGSMLSPATSDDSAPSHAQTPPLSPRARRARSAASPYASCVIASAPSDAATPRDLCLDAIHGAPSTPEHRRPIQTPCHALDAARPVPIGTTTTTPSPRSLNGSAPFVTSRNTTSRFRAEPESDPLVLPCRSIYMAKASQGERHAGCDELYWRADRRSPFGFVRVSREEWEALPEDARARGNVHPTVKSLALMQWLVSLITPPGGRVGDVTCGSGATGLAVDALNVERNLGASFIGADLCPEAIEIAEARLKWWQASRVVQAGLFGEATVIRTVEAAKPKPAKPAREKAPAEPPPVDGRQRDLWGSR